MTLGHFLENTTIVSIGDFWNEVEQRITFEVHQDGEYESFDIEEADKFIKKHSEYRDKESICSQEIKAIKIERGRNLIHIALEKRNKWIVDFRDFRYYKTFDTQEEALEYFYKTANSLGYETKVKLFDQIMIAFETKDKNGELGEAYISHIYEKFRFK